jgi:hypothetical protein
MSECYHTPGDCKGKTTMIPMKIPGGAPTARTKADCSTPGRAESMRLQNTVNWCVCTWIGLRLTRNGIVGLGVGNVLSKDDGETTEETVSCWAREV